MSKPAVNWNDLVELYYDPIFRFCLHMLASREEAEDITQETFIRAFKSLHSLDDSKVVKHWIYRIARNACIDRKRWWKRMFFAEARTEEVPAMGRDPELSITLSKLIAALPQRQREIFILRHLHGFSTEEVAEFLKLNQGTVKSQLKRAVDRIKVQLPDNQRGG